MTLVFGIQRCPIILPSKFCSLNIEINRTYYGTLVIDSPKSEILNVMGASGTNRIKNRIILLQV